MTKEELIKQLKEHLPDEPASDALIEEIEERYKDDPDLDAQKIMYWLDESLYSTLAWHKKHLEMGELKKADAELARAELVQDALTWLSGVIQNENASVPGHTQA